MIAIAGGLLAALGVLAAALLVAAPLGLIAAAPGLSLWILFPVLTLLGWFMLVVSDLDPLRGMATKLVAIPLFVIALLAVLALVAEAPALFALAAIVILAGLVGLIVHFRQQPTETETVDAGPRTLNIHKKHDSPVNRTVLEKFTLLESTLAEAMKSQKIPADWPGYAPLAAAAGAEAKRSDVVSAFRTRCRSLLFLSDSFHKARSKEESFRPSWTTPHRE